jgi:hypothetical protein
MLDNDGKKWIETLVLLKSAMTLELDHEIRSRANNSCVWFSRFCDRLSRHCSDAARSSHYLAGNVHAPGALIGKALKPLAKGKGETVVEFAIEGDNR